MAAGPSGGTEPPESRGPSRLLTRRRFLAAAGACVVARPSLVRAERPVTFGLTPVFLDSDAQLLVALERYLSTRLDRPVSLVKKRTYQEITLRLLSSQVDAAWICGFPYVQYQDRLALLAVPLYRGRPLYQSYIIVPAESPFEAFEDLRGQVHAFSDPDSNSGFLVTRHLLATMNETPDSFFGHTFFTYGHRNVVRAVSSGLALSGSVDGYVWEVMREIESGIVEPTRVIRKSEWLGFPPVVCNRSVRDSALSAAIARALITIDEHPMGREVLAMLKLDGFTAGDPSLFYGIERKYRYVLAQA